MIEFIIRKDIDGKDEVIMRECLLWFNPVLNQDGKALFLERSSVHISDRQSSISMKVTEGR